MPTTVERVQQAAEVHQRDGLKAALPLYQQLATECPGDPVVSVALGAVLGQVGQADKAERAFWHAATSPDAPASVKAHALGSLAVSYFGRGAKGEAQWCATRAVQLDPSDCASWHILGSLKAAAGRVDEAQTCWARAIAGTPRTAEDVWIQATVALLMGHASIGWRLCESRRDLIGWRDGDALAGWVQYGPHHPPPTGARVLVADEQGVGDTLQGMRFVRLLRNTRPDLRLTVALRPALVPLYAGAVDKSGVRQADYDGTLPLWSIPALVGLGSRVPAPWVPAGGGWRHPGHDIEHGRDAPVYVAERGAGALAHDWDRSAPPGALWGAVVNGWPDHRADLMPQCDGDPYPIVTHNGGAWDQKTQAWIVPSGRADTWADTARILRGCRACVTVDTGLAHLAGSLGVPTLLIPPTVGEWRWGVPGQRTRTDWYPSVRLHWRRDTHDWDVTQAVGDFLRGR